MVPVVLRTRRLTLSAPVAADVPAIYAACSDELVQRFTTVPSPYLPEHAEGFVEKAAQWWDEGSETTWAIRTQRAPGTGLVGMIGLHGLGRGDGEIGYWMAPDARRQGLLGEAGRAVIDWAFSDEGAGLARIGWRAVVGNVASARAARGWGFRYEGRSRAALVSGTGVRSDAWIAGLLPGDDRSPKAWPVLAASA